MRAERKKKHTSNIINILINNDVHSRIGIFVRSDVGDGQGFRHLDQPQCFSNYVERNKSDATRDLCVNNTMEKTGGEEEREMGEEWTSPGLLYGSKIANLGFKSARNGTLLLVC
jgi:hypothetical protein